MLTMNGHYAQTDCPKNLKFLLLLLYGSGNMHIKFHVTGPMGLRNIIVKPKKVSKKHCKEFKKKYFGTSNAPILMKFDMKFRERLKFHQKKFRSDSFNGLAAMTLHTRKHSILRVPFHLSFPGPLESWNISKNGPECQFSKSLPNLQDGLSNKLNYKMFLISIRP